MMQVYDRVLPTRNMSTLVLLAGIAAAMLLVMSGLDIVRSRILVRVSAQIDAQLSERILQATFASALASNRGTSAQGMRDLDTLRQYLGGSGPLAFFDIPWSPMLIGVVYIMHPVLGGVATGGALVLFSLALVNELATRKPLEDANRHSVGIIGFIGSSLRNAEVLHAMGMFENLRSRWFVRRNQMLRLQASASDRAGLITSLGKLLRQLLQVLLLATGAYLAVNGAITSGVIIASSIVVSRALAPFESAMNTWKQFVGARTAYARLNTLLSMAPPVTVKTSLPAPKGALALENIFAVPPGSTQPTLRQLSLRIPAGQVMGVIGPSGAGKTTLARLLVGAWPPYSGKVRLDGADIHHWNRDELGPYIGYLPQDVELFDGTVAENICRFGDRRDSKPIIAAAKRASVHEMILRLPQGYDTHIGSGGAALSGGQRQRIGLARALFGKPVLVVLDEPASNLDDEGEAALVEAVSELKRGGTTVVLISHRPEILSAVDQMLVLAQGAIRMVGPREEILARLSSHVVNAPQPVTSTPVAATAAASTTIGAPSAATAQAQAQARAQAPTSGAMVPLNKTVTLTGGGAFVTASPHGRTVALPDTRPIVRPVATRKLDA